MRIGYLSNLIPKENHNSNHKAKKNYDFILEMIHQKTFIPFKYTQYSRALLIVD